MKLRVTESDFWEIFFGLQNLKNGPKMGQKQRFMNFVEKFGH